MQRFWTYCNIKNYGYHKKRFQPQATQQKYRVIEIYSAFKRY